MQIIGHRGARDLAPENTIAGFKRALTYAPDFIELDVRTSSDGVPFVVHDPLLGRLTGKWQFVSRTSATTLRNLKTHHGEPLPTLAETLQLLAPRTKVIIELKTKSSVIPTLSLLTPYLKKHGYERFLVQSFWPHVLRLAHTQDSNLRLGLLLHINPLRFMTIKNLPLYGVGFYHKAITRAVVKKATARGLWIYAHTIDNPAEVKKLQTWGVQAIVTNRPDLFTSKQKAGPTFK